MANWRSTQRQAACILLFVAAWWGWWTGNLPVSHAVQTDWYYANTQQGLSNGQSCNDAYAWNDAVNGWGQNAPETAGNTIHICGTITGNANSTMLSAVNSGSGGSPITVVWEPNAMLQAPYFQGSRTTPTCGITTNGKNYWVFNGGANGVIQNTENGTGLANQADTCGINIARCTGCVVKNLVIANGYVHQGVVKGVTVSGDGTTATATCPGLPNCGLKGGETNIWVTDCSTSGLDGGPLTVTAVSGNTFSFSNTNKGSAAKCNVSDDNGAHSYGVFHQNCVNCIITGNTLHDWRWCSWISFTGSNSSSGVQFTSNNVYACDHGYGGGANGNSSSMTGPLIQFNQFHDNHNWDAYGDQAPHHNFPFHHNYIHIWATAFASAVINGMVICQNYFYGDIGTGSTAEINLESRSPASSYHNGTVVCDNVFANRSPTGLSPYGYISGGGQNEVFVNNTILGSSSSQSMFNGGIYMGGNGTGETLQNNIVSMVGFALGAAQSSKTWNVIDHNYYHNFNSQFYAPHLGGFLSLESWRALTEKPDKNSTGTNSAPNVQTAVPFAPTGSRGIINAGVNLTSMCSTTPQICVALAFNASKVPVAGKSWPASGNWNQGAVLDGIPLGGGGSKDNPAIYP